jgi:hypothetical protein
VSQEFANPADGVWSNGKAQSLDNRKNNKQSRLFRSSNSSHPEDCDEEFGIQEDVTESHVRRPQSSLLDAGEQPLIVRLFSTLPEPTIATLIMSRGRYSKLPIHLRHESMKKVSSFTLGVQQIAQVSELPSLTDPPIHFARKFFQFALCLQQLDETQSQRLEAQFKEPVAKVAKRYVEIASRNVTSQDALVKSLDGVETILLEFCYHINLGDLRTSWLLCRRAMAIAQLLGLPKAGIRTETLWFRLVYGDRFMSLLLGLPCAIPDNSVFVKKIAIPSNCPTEQLERCHIVILGHLVARNVSMQRRRREESDDDEYDDYKQTQEIDYELKQAIRCLPKDWWVIPILDADADDMETMAKTARLMAQLHHHYYLAVLHQPYSLEILRQRPTKCDYVSAGSTSDYTYNQTAALSASRGLLSCFMALRSFHRVLSYRALDDKAFTGATIMLLIHIDGHRLGRANVFEHQRPLDLALINAVINSIKDTSRWNQDKLSRDSIEMLEKLVEIEAEAAGEVAWYMWMENDELEEGDDPSSKRQQVIRLPIPSFGVLCMAHQKPDTSYAISTTSESVEMTVPTSLASTTSMHTDTISIDWSCIPTTLSAPISQPSRSSPLYVLPDMDSNLTWPSLTDISLIPRELPPPVRSIDEHDWLPQDINPAFFESWVLEETMAQEDEVEMD